MTAPLVGEARYTPKIMRNIYSARESGWRGDLPLATKRTAAGALGIRHLLFPDRRADFLGELASSIQWIGLVHRFPARDPADHAQRAGASLLRPGAFSPGARFSPPQGIQGDAQTPTVEEWNISVETTTQPQHVALRVMPTWGRMDIHGLLSVDPNTIAPQICGNASCTAGGIGTTKSTVPQGTLYVPVQTAPAGCAVCSSGQDEPRISPRAFSG